MPEKNVNIALKSFLTEFKRKTEEKWSELTHDPNISGFQLQKGTRWNPGLSDEKIAEYEASIGVQFPHDFKAFLREMNGTDIPTLNTYGHSGQPPRESIGVYSYPRDIEIVKQLINNVSDPKYRIDLADVLAKQGFDLPSEAKLVPIYIHRFVVCTPNLNSSVVLSIMDTDAIVYGGSLKEYLEKEFLSKRKALPPQYQTN